MLSDVLCSKEVLSMSLTSLSKIHPKPSIRVLSIHLFARSVVRFVSAPVSRVSRVVHSLWLHYFGPRRNDAIALHPIKMTLVFVPISSETLIKRFGKTDHIERVECSSKVK